MKKYLFIILLLLTSSVNLLADELLLTLNTRYNDLADVVGTKPIKDHRAPSRRQTILMSDRSIYLNGAFVGYRMLVVNEDDEVVYSYNILEGDDIVTIPFYIQGTYELQFTNDNVCYFCDIILE